tara:strand:- start:729 stop:1427 length:699 start_codon:yes stop_codon:yes gene_type:complete
MEQLLVALDVDTADKALELSEQLAHLAGGFKIGSRLFTSEGPDFVQKMSGRGHRIFLDLKYHDIPNTVADSVRAASDLGVWMLTLHTSGGSKMLTAAKEAAIKTSASPLLVGVTVLTSFDEESLSQLGITRSINQQVEYLATLAAQSGIDGVVASPLEAAQIRSQCGNNFKIVTPGIRLRDTNTVNDDQVRAVGPREALNAGSDYLVVGRPIIAAPNPQAAAAAICSHSEDR